MALKQKTASVTLCPFSLFFALLIGVLTLQWTCSEVSALEVAGVTVPETIRLQPDGPGLVLNGAGIRTKFFIKVYVGALYLKSKRSDVEAVLDLDGAKQVTMHFLHSEVSREKLVHGWNNGFSKNHSPEELEAVKVRLEKFNGLFRTVHKGDTIRLDYVPDKGTVVWINQEQLGTIQGSDFYRALLKVWLGAHPADRRLKEDMLGASK